MIVDSSYRSAPSYQQAPAKTEEEREARIRVDMERIILPFIRSDETVHHLSTDLNSYQRMIAHQVSLVRTRSLCANQITMSESGHYVRIRSLRANQITMFESDHYV